MSFCELSNNLHSKFPVFPQYKEEEIVTSDSQSFVPKRHSLDRVLCKVISSPKEGFGNVFSLLILRREVPGLKELMWNISFSLLEKKGVFCDIILRDICDFECFQKKRQVLLKLNESEDYVLQFNDDWGLLRICYYLRVSSSLSKRKGIVYPRIPLKGEGTNRAIPKTFGVGNKISSSGIYSKTKWNEWTKKQVFRWMDRSYYEFNSHIESILSGMKKFSLLDVLFENILQMEVDNRPKNIISKLRRFFQRKDGWSTLISSTSLTEYERKEAEAIGHHFDWSLRIIENLEVGWGEGCFFSKPYHKMVKMMIDQRGENVSLEDIERELLLFRTSDWDMDEAKIHMMAQFLFGLPLEKRLKDDENEFPSVIGILETDFDEFLSTKIERKDENKKFNFPPFSFFLNNYVEEFESYLNDYEKKQGFRIQDLSFKVYVLSTIQKHLKKKNHFQNIIKEQIKKGANKQKLEMKEEVIEQIDDEISEIVEGLTISKDSPFSQKKRFMSTRLEFYRKMDRRNALEELLKARAKYLLKKTEEDIFHVPMRINFHKQSQDRPRGFGVELMKEMDPLFNAKKFFRLDYVHSFFTFPGNPHLNFYWTPANTIRTRHWDDLSKGYEPLMIWEIPLVFSNRWEELDRIFERLGFLRVKWNCMFGYRMCSSKKGSGEKNGFAFVEAMLKELDIPIFPEGIKNFMSEMEKKLERGVGLNESLMIVPTGNGMASKKALNTKEEVEEEIKKRIDLEDCSLLGGYKLAFEEREEPKQKEEEEKE